MFVVQCLQLSGELPARLCLIPCKARVYTNKCVYSCQLFFCPEEGTKLKKFTCSLLMGFIWLTFIWLGLDLFPTPIYYIRVSVSIVPLFVIPLCFLVVWGLRAAWTLRTAFLFSFRRFKTLSVPVNRREWVKYSTEKKNQQKNTVESKSDFALPMKIPPHTMLFFFQYPF